MATNAHGPTPTSSVPHAAHTLKNAYVHGVHDTEAEAPYVNDAETEENAQMEHEMHLKDTI